VLETLLPGTFFFAPYLEGIVDANCHHLRKLLVLASAYRLQHLIVGDFGFGIECSFLQLNQICTSEDNKFSFGGCTADLQPQIWGRKLKVLDFSKSFEYHLS